MDVLEYKGYFAKIRYSVEDKVLFGKIEGIKDLVTFESNSINNIEKEFHQAVDDYLAYCADLGQEPDKIYSGNFNIRINPELHRQLSMAAIKNDISTNKMVEKAISEYFKTSKNRKLKTV